MFASARDYGEETQFFAAFDGRVGGVGNGGEAKLLGYEVQVGGSGVEKIGAVAVELRLEAKVHSLDALELSQEAIVLSLEGLKLSLEAKELRLEGLELGLEAKVRGLVALELRLGAKALSLEAKKLGLEGLELRLEAKELRQVALELIRVAVVGKDLSGFNNLTGVDGSGWWLERSRVARVEMPV